MIEPLYQQELRLETARLILCPLSMLDADLGAALFTDPEAVCFVGDVYSRDKLSRHLETDVRRGAGGRIGIWCVTRKDAGEKIGSGILLPLPINEDDTVWSLIVEDSYPDVDTEVGYLLVRSAWGQGFATEICRRLLSYGFEKTTLSEIVAVTHLENAASQNVLGKCGFKPDRWRRRCAPRLQNHQTLGVKTN